MGSAAFLLSLASCGHVRSGASLPAATTVSACTKAGVEGGDSRTIDGVVHTNVCVQLYLTDTGGDPQIGLKPSIRVNIFNKTSYLVGVTDFKGVPNQDGVYAGRVPVNKDDVELGFSILVHAAAYLDARSGLVRFSMDEVSPSPLGITLVRDLSQKPAAWYPRFDNSKVAPLIQSWIRNAKSLQFLRLKGDPKPVQDLGSNFASNALDDDPEFTLAKAALLNIYSELNRENMIPDGGSQHWLAYIEGLRAIGQERIIVAVSDKMLEKLRANLNLANDPFGCSGYHAAGAELHGRNFGLIVKPKKTLAVLSGKTPQCKGNLQLTVGQFDLGDGIGTQTFADIDFDDNYSFAAHSADVIDHWVNGSGTNPILIYQYLKARYSGSDLGYTVVRRGSSAPPLATRPSD